ncbi:MAG: OmpA family protein [Nitrospirota bacterium]|nr:OmpA family protein [Nitrospirota bacterium]
MSNEPFKTHSFSATAQGLESSKEDWSELRSLLLAPEQSQLDELRERLDNPAIYARDVSRVLPDAFTLRGKGDQHLATALAPFVEEGFAAAVRKSPRAIVDAIAPIMGPAIRQAIVRTLQSMMQSLNYSLEQSLSARGLHWRIEAWRTGRPFAEVVLLHTLRYRVEQVFLIHRETGLLLHHVAADSVAVQDQHVVSGMLAAIQSYVQDSFGASKDQTLDHFQVGEWTVWIEEGSQAFLAGVIQGAPPTTLRQHFRDAMDRIQVQQADALSDFHGDTAPFTATHPYLESCLLAHYEAPPQRRAMGKWILGGVLLFGCAWWGWIAYQSHARWSHFLTQLKTEPGVVVTLAESTLGGYRLEGLRDPLAKDPSTMLIAAGLDPSKITAMWSPYYALHPSLITTRVHSMLQPPKTVTLTLESNILVASGSASVEWARDARHLAPFIPGISGYRDDSLMAISIPDLLLLVNHSVIRFNSGSSIVEPPELAKLQTVMAALRNLDLAASQSGRTVSLEVLGSADETGPETMNLQLSESRAHAVLAAIGGKQFSAATTITTGIDSPFLKQQRGSAGRSADKRIVLLHATLTEPPNTGEAVRP